MERASVLHELPEKIRDWCEHNPTARRAYARLRADLTTVADRATPKLGEIWERIAPTDPTRGGAAESAADLITQPDGSPPWQPKATRKADR
jgi:hypothetical protein